MANGREEISLVLCGEAGMGIQTVEYLLTRILRVSGCHVFATKEYMSRVRGGMNSTLIRVGAKPVSALVDRIDILIPLNKGAVEHLGDRVGPETIVLGERSVAADDVLSARFNFIEAPFTKVALEIGNKVYANTVAVGAIAGLLGVGLEEVVDYVGRHFAKKGQDVAGKNVEAVQRGYTFGADMESSGRVDVKVGHDPAAKGRMLLSGGDAVGLGAVAGGCSFVSSYPMSPSTPVLTFLAKKGAEFGIVVEQAEDEIAAINMALGAWYAGARAMVTTSGGGFALMVEGLSLAGMLETPIVVHLAQRPGPATGLPTRTEQADLELALYAGHGEFPRVIFAPGTLEEAFYLTAKAFNMADKYQVPAFVLTDQYFIDSYYDTPAFDLSRVKVERHIVKTARNYRRYEITPDGVSPRGIPGYGEGLVGVDSDEHDAEGHITEDLELRTKMVDKRLRKLEGLKREVIEPRLYPQGEYKNLVVCWGSTYHIVKEAIERLGRKDTSLLHYSQVYPLHQTTKQYLEKARRVVLVEGNATGQLGRVIKLACGFDIERKILKYSGLSFSVEELVERLQEALD